MAKTIAEEVGERIRARRTELAMSQRDIAFALGLTQTDVSKLENAKGAWSDERRLEYAFKLDADPVQIRFQSEQGRAKHDAFTKDEDKAKPAEPEPASKASKPEQLSGIAREIRAFQRKHGATYEDVGDIVGLSRSYIAKIAQGSMMPSPETVAKIRSGFTKYDGILRQPGSKPEFKPQPPKTPSVPHAETVAAVQEVTGDKGPVPAPSMRVRGQFIPDGGNIAPVLVLDGKTMHVFTLVPGGVYVSHIAPKE